MRRPRRTPAAGGRLCRGGPRRKRRPELCPERLPAPRPQRADLYAALDRYPSSLRYPVRYLPGEIYLYVTDRGAWYDLLAADWAEGHTLDYAIRRALHYRSSADLTALSRAFEAMAAELLAQPWAHGDLKPSNIMVTPSGTLRLIDYDGAFVPERAAETAADPAPAAPCSSECLPFVPERIADGTDRNYRAALLRAENRRDERLVALLHALRAPEPALPALADLLRAPSKNR